VIRLDSAMILGLKVKRQELGRLVSFGTFRTVDMLACLMLMQIDRLVVGAYLGAASIAYYSIPQSLAQQLAHMATSMTEPLFPRLSQMLATHDHEGARNLYRRGTRLLVWFISTAVGCVIVMCDLLFRFWLGTEFAARAAPIMRWLALGWGLTAVSVVGIFALNAFGLPEINAGARILQAFVLLAGCVALVPRLGAIAAAYSLAGSMLLTVPLYLAYVDYRMDLRSLEVAVDLYLKPLLIGTVVLVVGAALRQIHGRVYEVGLLVTLPALSLGLALELGIISRAEREMGRALLAQAWSALYSRGLVALLRARPGGLL
jgi:O-antigen/teichoic acid export membrane protein